MKAFAVAAASAIGDVQALPSLELVASGKTLTIFKLILGHLWVDLGAILGLLGLTLGQTRIDLRSIAEGLLANLGQTRIHVGAFRESCGLTFHPLWGNFEQSWERLCANSCRRPANSESILE